MDLAKHPIWEATDPMRCRLVRLSAPLPSWPNPFTNDGVIIRIAAIPGDVLHSKSYMARELLLGGVSTGAITRGTIVVEASSGNTAQAEAVICNALGIPARFIMNSDTVADKVNAVGVVGSGIEVILHANANESTVERARREGAQDGHYNPDQYASSLNADAHKKYLARQLFQAARNTGFDIAMLFVASGTMGTASGPQEFATERGLPTRVFPVMCSEGEEVPGARTLKKVRKDIKSPWEKIFSEKDIEFGTRHESFLLSYLSWRWVPQLLGPSFGLAFQGALQRISKARAAGMLDHFRDANGKVEVVVLGPDSYMPYIGVMRGELRTEELIQIGPTPDLMKLLNLPR